MTKRLHKGVGLGTFPFASPFTPIDENEAIKIIHTFLDMGGQYIDTAPTYAFGETERLVGKALKTSNVPRNNFFLGSMCGFVLDDNNQFIVSGKFADVIHDCEMSLKQMQVDSFDVYMSHLPDPETPFDETMGALAKLKEQGKIQHIGVSNINLDQLKEYNKDGLVEFVENRYSLLNQNFSDEFLQYCKENNISIVVFQVIERGLLTKKVLDGIVLRDEDLRNKKPEFAIEIRERIGIWVKEFLEPIALDLGVNISTLALWWALQQPEITICLNGATSETQLRTNFQAMSIEPPVRTLKRVNDAYDMLVTQLNQENSMTVREFMGLAEYNIYKGGSPSGKK